jgi:inner membrane protein
LLIGSNLPDIDVLAYAAGPLTDLEWRRGWTHGILALAVLPFLLTGALLLVARIRIARWRTAPPVVRPRELLLLSSLALLSHPMLDTLNTYGVRWLMPFSGRWFYGDVLFIVDPWLWLLLAGGLVWTWTRRSHRPVRGALLLALAYVGAMAISSVMARIMVRQAVAEHFGGGLKATMVGPLPLTPFTRNYVVKQNDGYRVGTFRWLSRPHVDIRRVVTYPQRRPRQHPAYALAESTPLARRFLGWARFPTFSVQQTGPTQYLVHIVDLRYARMPGVGFGTVTVPVHPGLARVDQPVMVRLQSGR